MTNLDIQSAYLGLDPVEKVYLGTDEVWSGGTPEPTPQYVEFNEWYGRAGISSSNTLGNILLINPNSIVWNMIGEPGYLCDTSNIKTDAASGSSYYSIKFLRAAGAGTPPQYHNTGTTNWSYLTPTGTEMINGIAYDKYELPVNVYIGGNNYNLWNRYIIADSLYILPPDN